MKEEKTTEGQTLRKHAGNTEPASHPHRPTFPSWPAEKVSLHGIDYPTNAVMKRARPEDRPSPAYSHACTPALTPHATAQHAIAEILIRLIRSCPASENLSE